MEENYLPPHCLQDVILEGENVKIGSWLNRQRAAGMNPVNSERYRLLKEYRMLDQWFENRGKQKNIRLKTQPSLLIIHTM
jgi:hypothetical protein